MPCPYFEPQRVAANRKSTSARLPLIDEYEGLCHATEPCSNVPYDVRFPCCNHGYSRGVCTLFPRTEESSCIRFDVVARSVDTLELLCIEERQYAPYHWNKLRYFIETGSIEPGVADTCTRAQVEAFCRSYLLRFPG